MDGQQFDINKKESMDLLEYITIYSNKHLPGFDPDTGEQTDEQMSYRFALRYNNKSIGNKFTKDDYLHFREVQSTLKAYQLDSEKFWYFLLFIFDYTQGAGNGIHSQKAPIKELNELFKAIDNNLEVANGLGFFSAKNDMELSLKVKSGKRFKTICVRNPNAMAFLSHCFSKASEEEKTDLRLTASNVDFNYYYHLSQVERIGTFTHYMKLFMDDCTVKDKPKCRSVSIGKMIFISRLVYLTRLGTDIKFAETDKGPKKNYLRDYLSGHKYSEFFNFLY